MEQWKPIVGWEGIYEVSDQGRVRRIAPGGSSHVGHVFKVRLNASGYPVVILRNKPREQSFLVNRLVAAAFIGPPPPDRPETNHIDGDKTHNTPANLEYVSRSTNMTHNYRVLGSRGGFRSWDARGESHPNSKLSRDQADEIRRLATEGLVSQRTIAAQFGVTQSLVSCIKRGITRGQ